MLGGKNRAYQLIAEDIRGRILSRELKPGDRVPGISELAERHGVAYLTARRAIRELVDSGSLECRSGVGTFVRRMEPRSLNLGMVFHSRHDTPTMANPLVGRLCDGFMKWLAATGARGVTIGYDWSPEPAEMKKVAADVLARGFNGVALVTARAYLSKFPDVLTSHLPVVAFEPEGYEPICDTVTQDELTSMELKLAHLTEMGARRIAYCTSDDYARRPKGWDRERAFKHVACRLGVDAGVIFGDAKVCAGEIAARRHEIDAIVFFSDPQAGAAREELRALGVEIPRDMLFVAHDNYERDGIAEPFFTTIDPDFEGMGARAAELLLDRVLGNAPARPVLYAHPGRLVVRASSRRGEPVSASSSTKGAAVTR